MRPPDFLQPPAGSLPIYYESTGIESFFRDDRDPDPRSRRVFGFHRPETLTSLLSESNTLRARLRTLPALTTDGMRGCQVEAITSLEPFAESVSARFERWLTQKVEAEDFEFAPFNQRGGLGRAARLFGDGLSALLDELNETLAA